MTSNPRPASPSPPPGPVPGTGTGSGARAAQPTLGELVARISENITGLIKGEIDLAKAKGKRMAVKLGLGIGLLGAAGVLALYAFAMLLHAAARGIGEALPLWAGYLIVAVVLLIIVAVLAVVGKKKIDAGLADTPSPQEGLKQNVEIAKEALASGLEKGNQK